MGGLTRVVAVALCATAPVLGTTPSAAAAPALSVADAARPLMCHGKVVTIAGTGGVDDLRGTPGPDVIAGFTGDDAIKGLGGNDTICGGKGADHLWGGPGNDRLYGELDALGSDDDVSIADSLSGGPGDDLLDGGYDNRPRRNPYRRDLIDFHSSRRGINVDLTRGWAHGQGHDWVSLRDGTVILTNHDDRFVGTTSTDWVLGLRGKDHVRTGRGADRVDALQGEAHWVSTGPGVDYVWPGAGDSTIRLGRGDDGLNAAGGSSSVDRFYLGPGSDSVGLSAFSTGTGQLFDAGPGHDSLYVGADPADWDFLSTWDMATGEMHVGEAGTAVNVTHFEFAELIGRWTVHGTNDPDEIATIGTIGSSFYGRGGNDRYSGSYYDDNFDGGKGHDTYVSDTGGVNTCTSVEADPHAVCAAP